MLRELTENESNIVSGGNANSGYEGSNCTNAAIKGGVLTVQRVVLWPVLSVAVSRASLAALEG